MDATVKKVLAEINSGKHSPVYVLQGEEAFYIDLISNYVQESVLSESEKPFNQVVLYGRDAPVNAILTHARRFPMMADKQVVLVKEAQDIPDLGKETGQKQLMDYFSKPVPTTLLVLCHKYKTLDKRKELGKKADKLVPVITFKKPASYQLPAFVEEYFREKGFSVSGEASHVLCESVGNDLSRLANEIDKMLIGRTGGETVTADLVMAQVGISREYNIFELEKSIIALDAYRAQRIARYFGENPKRNPAIMVVAYLYNYFSRLLNFAAASVKGDAANNLGINQYAMKDYTNALRNYPLGKIIANISLLKQTDLRLKGVNSSSEEEGEILRELVARLIR